MKRTYTLDKVVAVLVLGISLFLIFMSFIMQYYSGTHLLVAVFIGALLYILFRDKITAVARLPSFQLGSRTRSLSHIVFIISISLNIFISWNSLYFRPPVYFILCLVAATSIILNIFALDETKKSQVAVALFKIIVLSLSVYGAIYYQFPGVYGNDPWWHTRWVQETVNLGQITPGEYSTNDYALFPVFHLASAILQIISEVTTRTAVFLSIGGMMAISGVFMFLIGDKLVGAKVGLLATLLLLLADEFLGFATNVIPMSLGFCFFLPIIYIVLCSEKRGGAYSLLLLLLSVALVLTHTIAAFVTLLSLIVVFFGIRFFKKIDRLSVSYESVLLTLIIFFGVAMLARWMQSPETGTRPFFDMNMANLVRNFETQAGFVMTGPVTLKNVSPIVTIFNSGGYLVLLALGVIGALIFLHPKNRTGPIIALVSIAAFITIALQIFQLFVLRVLLPDRWQLFSYVGLSVLAIFGLLQISSLIKGNIRRMGVITLVVIAYIFMMVTNARANTESPLIFNGAMRFAYTQSELDVIHTLADIEGGCPTTDFYYGTILPYVAGYDEYRNMLHKDSRVFIRRNYYLQHPEWNDYYMSIMIVGGIEDPTRRRKLVTDYMEIWGIDKWPVIYKSNGVTVYSSAPVLLQNR